MPALANALVLEHPGLVYASGSRRCRYCGNTRNGCVAPYEGGNWYCPECFERRWHRCAECGDLVECFDSHNFQHDTGEEVRICGRCRQNLNVWEPTPMDVSFATYEKIGSKRKFGVEIETAECPRYRNLKGQNLFGAKFDCSISGMEFISPILYGDEGLAEIEKICDQAAERGWVVDSDCGLHIHLDMRGESVAALKSVAYAYILTDKVWRKLADSYRADNCTYCRAPGGSRARIESTSDTMESWENYCNRQDRYELCNLNAFTRHGTYEIRLYQGSIDKAEITNWIKIHTRFIDWAATKTIAELDAYFEGNDNMKWEGVKMLLGDFPLVRYWISKRRRGRNTPSRLQPARRDDDDYNDDDCDDDCR
jgi:hypothetical protein